MASRRQNRPTLDRAAIMRDAHLRFKQGKRLRLGWTFAQCLSTAWAAHRIRTRDRMPVPVTRSYMVEAFL